MDALLERMRLMEVGMTHAGAAAQASEARATAAEAQLQHAIGQMQQMGQQANGSGTFPTSADKFGRHQNLGETQVL